MTVFVTFRLETICTKNHRYGDLNNIRKVSIDTYHTLINIINNTF